MKNRQKIWLWVSVAVSLIVGFILVMNDSGAGWFLIIMGMTYIGVSTRFGHTSATSTARVARWGWIGSLVLLLAVVVLSTIMLLK